MRRYWEAAWERAMKVQEVILGSLAKRITWWPAAEILGMTERSMRRWKWRWQQYGYEGLFDRRRGRPSPRRVPVETVEEVLRLYQGSSGNLCVNGRPLRERMKAPSKLHGLGDID
jgi:Helix-turn-helix domain